MKSFSFAVDDLDGNRLNTIYREIQENRLYFRKFCGSATDEAMSRSLSHAMTHFDASKGNLTVYLKSLAKTIVSQSNQKCVCVDFLEQTCEDNLEDEATETKIQSGLSTSDFSQDVVDDLFLDIDKSDELIDLALTNMKSFLKLCDYLKNENPTNLYCTDVFKKSCLSLSERCRNFNAQCLALYDEYKEDMERFISSDEETIGGKWVEADYTFIDQRISKRVRLLNENGGKIEDADIEPFIVKGSLKGKKIVRVRYKEQYEELLDLVDSPVSNEIKFVLNNRYIIKTLGGSLTVANPKLYSIYELVEREIVTNLLRDTDNSGLLNIGSECMYFLCNEKYNMEIPERIVKGIKLSFTAEEVEV